MKGFSLLELIIAISLFAIVAVTVFSIFNSGIASYKKIDESLFILQNSRIILDRISQDLKNSFLFSQDLSGFIGGPNEVSFFCLIEEYKENQLKKRYAHIYYSFNEDKIMRLCLKDKDALKDKKELKSLEEPLAEDIKDLTFNYSYFSDQKDVSWQDSWLEKEKAPLGVKINLTLFGPDKKRTYNFEKIVYISLGEETKIK